MAFNEAIQSVWQLIVTQNGDIQQNTPWVLYNSYVNAKSIGQENSEIAVKDWRNLKNILGRAAQTLKASAILLYPFMPSKMQMIWEQLGHAEPLESIRIDITNPSFFTYEKGQKIKRGPAPFPRIETERIKALKAASEAKAEPQKKEKPQMQPKEAQAPQPAEAGVIKIDDFMKVDLRVGKVLEAERVEKSDKLIKMQIDIGSETRQIVGGIGKAYSPEQLAGRTVIVVANLKPAKLMGIESQGMVLAAGGVDTLKLAEVPPDIEPGTKVK